MTESGIDDLAVPEQPAPHVPQAGDPVPPPAQTPWWAAFLEWLTRRNALAEARLATAPSPVRIRRLRRGATEFELADRALDPAEQLPSGSGVGLALDGFRRASFWALVAEDDRPIPRDVSTALASANADQVARAAGGVDSVARLRDVLVGRSFVDDAELPEETLRDDALLVRGFAIALLEYEVGPDRAVKKLMLQRFWRSLLLLSIACGVVGGGFTVVRAATQKPNIALGKPWRASSEEYKCHPEIHECAGARLDVVFHTKEEDSPWFEIDLGKPMPFSSVEVTNRSDCCGDRALPLIVETSDDRRAWSEAARRTDSFTVWRATFALRTARYVRVRVPRKTILHLEGVLVR